jgi:predicted transcriptional regulator
MAMPISVKDSQVCVRLPTGLKAQMETYAELTGRTKSYVAMEALTEYLAWRIPQIEDLKQAIAAADSGDFASDAEAQALFARYAAGKPPSAKRPSLSRRASPAKRK